MKKHIASALCMLLLLLCGFSSSAAEQHVVRVGAFNYYPAIFKDNDNVVKGFYVDALTDLGRRENIRFEYVFGSWSEGLERIKSGEVDLLTSVAYTDDRAEYMDFGATPLLTVWGELYVPFASTIDGIREVQGKRVAVMKGDFNARHFIGLVNKFGIPCEFVELAGFEDVFKAIAAHEVDAGVVNSTFGVAKQHEYGLRSTGVVFNPFDIFFAVAKGKNQRLLTLLDRYLADWRHQPDSPYNKARQKWSHGNTGMIRHIPHWLINSFAVLVLLALGSVVFNLVLKKQVHSKTRSIAESAQKYQILNARQEAILAAIPDIIMEADTNRVYTWSNNAGIEFFGDDVVGKDCTYYFEREQNTIEIVKPLYDGTEKLLYVESWQRRKDGEVRLLAWWCKAIEDEHGAVTGTLSSARDITEQKKTEEEKAKLESQLMQAKKMESVGRLAGGVAHDFNNMLTVILGQAELGLMKIDPSHPLAANFTEIQKMAERSADLTRQLLAFARKQTVAPKVLDLNGSVSAMLNMLQRLIGENIRLAWQPAPGLWQVKMDPSQIDQILANLCVNARDAIEDTGLISIETENSTIDADFCSALLDAVPGEYVKLTVRDDGVGMDKEIVAHIFEPFFTTKELGKGTGLGLATVYGVVKQNNGFISICSNKGQGTTFSIYLPRHEVTCSQALTGGSALPALHGQETVLLVEDERSILDLVTIMLKQQGYTVLTASTPGEAIRLAREHAGEIHLLMTDVILPEMNGRDLAKNLLSLYPHMRRLFMSGYTANIIAHHGVLDEGVHFIQKPFSLPTIAAKVREVMDGN